MNVLCFSVFRVFPWPNDFLGFNPEPAQLTGMLDKSAPFSRGSAITEYSEQHWNSQSLTGSSHELTTLIDLRSYRVCDNGSGGFISLRACPGDYRPAPHYESRVTYYDYRYYPEADCYYDTRTRVYIYFEHDHWVRARALPPRMRSYLGKHVNIRSLHDRPYEDVRRHREQYAPDRHKSEHYNKVEPDHRGRDIRNDAPRRDISVHENNDSRKYADSRDRNGQDQSHSSTRDRSTGTNQRHQSAPPTQEQQRSESKSRSKPGPKRHEAPVSKAPTKRDDKTRESENHNEKTRDRNRDEGQQRSNNRHDYEYDYDPRAWNERNSPEENSARDR